MDGNKKYKICPKGGQPQAAYRPAKGWLSAGRIIMTP
jgi:hypothetical protein